MDNNKFKYLMVGSTWIAGIVSFTVLVINGHEWWGLLVLLIAGCATVKEGK